MAGGGISTAVTNSLHVILIMVPVLAHFLLICFALLNNENRETYLYSHVFFVLLGVWCCIDRTSVYPIIMFIVVLLMTILLDIIQLGLFYRKVGGNTKDERTLQFSQGMMIMSLIFKPLTCLLAFLALYIRHTGGLPTTGGGRRDSYSVIHGQDGQQSE